MNENTCILTLMEKKIRLKIYGTLPKNQDCFTCRLFEPVYDFKSNNENNSHILYISLSILWLITMGKIIYKHNIKEIKNLNDFFK